MWQRRAEETIPHLKIGYKQKEVTRATAGYARQLKIVLTYFHYGPDEETSHLGAETQQIYDHFYQPFWLFVISGQESWKKTKFEKH